MSMMRYKFDVAAEYSLDGDLAASGGTRTSDAIDMNLDSGTLVADWVGAMVHFKAQPAGGTDDTLRLAILFSHNNSTFEGAPTGTFYIGAMGPGGVPHAAEDTLSPLDKLVDVTGTVWPMPPVDVWNFYIVNRSTTATYLNFAVQVVPAAVAFKIHLYKSSGTADAWVISETAIRRYRTAMGDF